MKFLRKQLSREGAGNHGGSGRHDDDRKLERPGGSRLSRKRGTPLAMPWSGESGAGRLGGCAIVPASLGLDLGRQLVGDMENKRLHSATGSEEITRSEPTALARPGAECGRAANARLTSSSTRMAGGSPVEMACHLLGAHGISVGSFPGSQLQFGLPRPKWKPPPPARNFLSSARALSRGGARPRTPADGWPEAPLPFLPHFFFTLSLHFHGYQNSH